MLIEYVVVLETLEHIVSFASRNLIIQESYNSIHLKCRIGLEGTQQNDINRSSGWFRCSKPSSRRIFKNWTGTILIYYAYASTVDRVAYVTIILYTSSFNRVGECIAHRIMNRERYDTVCLALW